MKNKLSMAIAAGLLVATASTQAFGWGATGHTMIGNLAMENLPTDEGLPAFLFDENVPFMIGELSVELDRSKGAGQTHDFERDPAHYVDFDDEGRVFGGPTLEELPISRRDYDTLLRELDLTQYHAGYLPYALVDGWLQLRKDFALWRALEAAEDAAEDPALAARFARERELREMLILRDLGVWAHYVQDATMPLHLSVHFDAWGDYPNPNGYNTERGLHAKFEGAYVRANITDDEIMALVPEFRERSGDVWVETREYLAAGIEQIIPLWDLDKAGAFDAPNAEGETFVAGQLAAAVAELRDLVVMAWVYSDDDVAIGYPNITLEQIEAGEDAVGPLFGLD